MRFRTDKISPAKIPVVRLAILFVASLVFLIVFQWSRKKTPVSAYPQMVQASRQMELATREIRKYRQELYIAIDPLLDPLQTGFLGTEITPLTTTLGNLEAKQTAVNPDFAALILRWLVELELQSGNRVALQLSGSFPALNLAAIIACETLEIEPLITSSVGASSFGANLPEFTYLEMEKRLFEKGIIHHHSALVTGGGNNDLGEFLWDDSDSLLKNAVQKAGYKLFKPESLSEAVQTKWQYYNSEGIPDAFINIGGNHTTLGNCSHSSQFPTGLIKRGNSCAHPDRGLLMYFYEGKIPVIHLLEIRSLAVQSGLPLSPEADEPAGNSDIYFTIRQPLWLKILLTTLLLLTWSFLFKPQRISRSFRITSTRER